MSSLEPFVRRVKPALDAFLRAHSKVSLEKLQTELEQFNWSEMKIFHIQILIPLVMKLDEITDESQELRTGTIDCVRIVTSNLYLNDLRGLRTMLVILLRQIRDLKKIVIKPDLSEEIKLAVLRAITEALRRSTSDVLEQFYTNDTVSFLGQLLLTLVEFIAKEKYKQILMASLHLLLTTFYVHDEADFFDVVLRNQVANILFLFVPKVVSVLINISLADDKIGDTIKSTAIQSLGRIICVMCEVNNDDVTRSMLNATQFNELIKRRRNDSDNTLTLNDGFMNKQSLTDVKKMEERMKHIQDNGRNAAWFEQTSYKLSLLLERTYILRSHQSLRVRYEYAKMCVMLLNNCSLNLKDCFIHLLENVIALAEDDVNSIQQVCQKALQDLQTNLQLENLFDENCVMLFDKHLSKLPRIINRCDDDEQYAEFLFLKGLLHNLSSKRLYLLLAIPKNLDIFCMCLLTLVDMKATRDFLVEEYSLRQWNETDIIECKKLQWRQYTYLNDNRCIQLTYDICGILGHTTNLNRIIFEYLLELLAQESASMNEVILLMSWIATAESKDKSNVQKKNRFLLVDILMSELLMDKHWHLVLQPDEIRRLHVNKQSDWFVDRTPGLYESAVEMRVQDCDSDDEQDTNYAIQASHVSIADVQFNVLHTCIVLDVLGHCATFLGDNFDAYLFRCLHHVLLKFASSNCLIYQSALFALTSMQRALHFTNISQLIETHNDYITYHLKMQLKRATDSRAAVDLLSVVIQFSNKNALSHLEGIFETIQDECTKIHQSENINSYLKVYNAFLQHIERYHINNDIDTNSAMQCDDDMPEINILDYWLKPLLVIEQYEDTNTVDMDFSNATSDQIESEIEKHNNDENTDVTNTVLPKHIEIVKNLLNQILKFLTSTNQAHQILSLECLISGVPLLINYEDELLPLVHLIWQPFVKIFQQENPIVLYRCFSLLNILASGAKDFILKRSLDDIVPYLKRFLSNAAKNSSQTTITVQTQEHKLQIKLLNEFGNLIQNIRIDGRHLSDISESIVVYLCTSQPIELQNRAIQFFQELRLYNGPLSYLVIMKRSHLPQYTVNIKRLLNDYQIK